MMKNILRTLALVAVGAVSMAASANAMPAVSSVAGVGEQATTSVEQVGWGHRGGHGHGYGHKFYGKRYWGGYHHGYKHYGYGYGGGFSWKKYCYHNPYHWKCKHFDY